MEKQNKQYEIGDDSRQFLNALDAFQMFENVFMDALQNLYGEEQGEQLYLSHVPQFEDVERTVMDYLRILFTQQMGTADERVTI